MFPKKRPSGWNRTSILPSEEQQKQPVKPKSTLPQGAQDAFERLEQTYRNDPSDIPNAMEYLNAMQYYEYHSSPPQYTQQLMQLYESLQQQGKQALESNENPMLVQVLCRLYTEQGKWMFQRLYQVEEAMARWNESWRERGDAWRALGMEYNEQAIQNHKKVLQYDQQDVPSSSLALLQLAELMEASSSEWESVVTTAEQYLSDISKQTPPIAPQAKYHHASTIHRLHLALMWYHLKHGNVNEAREHLQIASRTKAATLPPWQVGTELQKVQSTRSIFRQGVWAREMGSSTKTPIFVMGFIESGAEMVERHLVASHSSIVPTFLFGMEPAFVGNSRPDGVGITSRSSCGRSNVGRQRRGEMRGTRSAQFVIDSDWMNYFSIGLIHMIFPEALIVHVVRDPLENLLAAHMHDSSSLTKFGILDYTCDWNVLVELYQAYREMMQHWDDVLPGRITHVRYEDWVADPTGMASALLERINVFPETVLVVPHQETVIQAFRPYKEGLGRLSALPSDLVVYNLPSMLRSPRLQEESHLDREHVEL